MLIEKRGNIIEKIKETLDKIRPYLLADGGILFS
jgi:hypothetical protein